MTPAPSPLPHIASIQAYPPGRPIAAVARDFGLDPGKIVKLASNENPLGTSPEVTEALARAAAEVNRYPDFDCFDLYRTLSKRLDVAEDRIALGAGSSEIIQLVVRAFMGAGHKAVIPRYSFTSYESSVRAAGGNAVVVPNRGWAPDLDGMLAAIDEQVRIVFLASPNNPTGVLTPPQELAAFIEMVPDRVVLVLDEAYREYVAPENRLRLERMFARKRNLLVLRTFSKVYGLAGLRVGYGLGAPDLIGILRRLAPPFSVNSMAQGGALAALGDQDFVARSVALNATERGRLSDALDRHGFEYVPSSGNFVLLHVGDGPAAFQALMRRGVIVRPVANYGLGEWIRVSIGLPEENDLFLRHLTELFPNGSRRAKAE